MKQRRRPSLQLGLPMFLAVLVAVVVPAAAPAAAVELEEVLTNFDRVQDSIRTLSADFTETTKSTLLKDAVVGEGKVFLTKPDAVRWEYSAPEEMRFIIANDRYTGYFPVRKRAEKRDIRRWREQLFRFLGLGQASAELGKFYAIRLDEAEPDDNGNFVLVLDPKKKRVRKRMEGVRFTVSSQSWLPVKVEYRSKNGSTRVIEFREMVINPELGAELYVMELPSDVDVTKGFSALSGLSASTND